MQVDEVASAEKVVVLSPHLNERQRRLLAGAEARSLGRGGMTVVARASGLSMPTIRKGMGELAEKAEPMGGVRRSGGGRKSAVAADPALPGAVGGAGGPDSRGDLETPLRWTIKSTR